MYFYSFIQKYTYVRYERNRLTSFIFNLKSWITFKKIFQLNLNYVHSIEYNLLHYISIHKMINIDTHIVSDFERILNTII